MGLFGSIQMGGGTLRAMQIGLHVVGNNIANANTPGYIRQEAIFVPGPVQKHGHLILGTGVLVDSIVQKLDRFVLDRLIGARSDRAGAEVQEEAYRDLEVMLNELSAGEDLSNALVGFFNAIDEVMNDPANVAMRHLAVGKGITLTQNFANLHSRAVNLQQEFDRRVAIVANDINTLAEQIRVLNVRIASAEGGDPSGSDAGGLRVQRQAAIDQLSSLVSLTATEQVSGGVSIAVGSDLLVFEGQRRAVVLKPTTNTGQGNSIIELADTRSPLKTASGELAGLYAARDEIVSSFLSNLDELAGALAFEFNKLYAQGQGLVGFRQLTSVDVAKDANAPLDAAGLAFTPVSGAFDVLIHSKSDNLTRTHKIIVDLNGLDEDTSLASLAQQLGAIPGLSASVTNTGGLQLAATSADVEFAVAGDTSGVLAALGLNTFFTGSSAATLGVNSEIREIDNAAKFAASLGGIGVDAGNAERLSAFLNQPLEAFNNTSLADLYNQLLNEVTRGAAITQSVAEGYRVFEGTLEGQLQAVSGVSIDEEAIKMITMQRIYQASARYIHTISELLDLLVRI